MRPIQICTLGQVLSITHDVLLCDMGGVYGILNYMCADKLFTHQLPRAAKECKPHLLAQFPQLATVDVSRINNMNWQTELAKLVAEHGNEFAVNPLPEHAHEFIDPHSELAEKVHPDKIITVAT